VRGGVLRHVLVGARRHRRGRRALPGRERKAGFDVSAGFASNGYGDHSPGGYSLQAALITEVMMTMMFLVIILGATDKRAPQGFAPILGGMLGAVVYRFIGGSGDRA